VGEAALVNRCVRNLDTCSAEFCGFDPSQAEVRAYGWRSLAAVEKIGQIRLRDLQPHPFLDLDSGQTIAAGVFVLRSVEKAIARTPIYYEAKHLADFLPNTEQTERIRRTLRSQLHHAGSVHAPKERGILHRRSLVAGARDRSSKLGH